MSELELRLIQEAEHCTFYSIQFVAEDDTEFEKFYAKFKDDMEYNPDLMRIVRFLNKIAKDGALERFFRPEGKMRDHVVALPVVQSKLRLYCLRLSDKILVLGNGGVKTTRTYDEDNELQGYVLTLQKFEKLLTEGQRNGSIIVDERSIITDNTFEI